MSQGKVLGVTKTLQKERNEQKFFLGEKNLKVSSGLKNKKKPFQCTRHQKKHFEGKPFKTKETSFFLGYKNCLRSAEKIWGSYKSPQ